MLRSTLSSAISSVKSKKFSNNVINSINDEKLNLKLDNKVRNNVKENLSTDKTVKIPIAKTIEAKYKEWSINDSVILEERLSKICESIPKASSSLIKTILINDLFKILYENPDLRYVIHQKYRILFKQLIALRESSLALKDNILAGNINECLALLGYIDQTKIKQGGLNILSLDGGGSKGFVTIEILKSIEKHSGKKIHELFDYICGVSTGAVLASLVGILKMPLDEVEKLYSTLTQEVFKRKMTAGIGNLLKSYSYYDTQVWESTLQNIIGDLKVINSSRDKNSCKLGIVSNVTTANHMKIFLFRNYNLPPMAESYYDGTSQYKCWEAIRASSAAPGYYEDFKLDGYVFHDGGLLANNPTAIAIHEAKHLWPKHDTNCVVSIGNGRFKPAGYDSSKANSISLRQKLARVFSGIGDPEVVHSILLDTMKPSTYFRFNPYMTEEFNLDEARPEKYKMMQYETNMYIRRNDLKFKMLSKQLLKPQSNFKKLQNCFYNTKFNCNLLQKQLKF
jgi:calcium-independent phospholipase A2-gamma